LKRLPKPDIAAFGAEAANTAAASAGPEVGATDGSEAGPQTSGLFQETGKGFGIAYSYLNRRERTVSEVTARLQKAEIDEREIEQVLEELLQFGYLDDARYARVFAEDKRNLEQWGNDRITRTLRERGVDREVISSALAALPAHDERGQALELITRRFPGGPSVPKDRDRAFGVLIRKGYDSEIAADAVRAWARSTSPAS
jgi:regulatory protein